MRIESFVFPLRGTVIIAGSNGLIGGAIAKYLLPSNPLLPCSQRALEFEHSDLLVGIKELLSIHYSFTKDGIHMPVLIIYACGKGGFGIDEAIAGQQIARLALLVNSLPKQSSSGCYLMLISSLGAKLSTVNSSYKDMTAEMERIVLQCEKGLILRLPGIWGCKEQGGKDLPCGLIGHLLASAITGREAVIFGDLCTTRYYLAADTVGKSIAAMVKSWTLEAAPKIQNYYPLFPYSIFEIISLISRVLSKKVFYRLLPGAVVDRESLILRTCDGSDTFMQELLLSELRAASWIL